MASLRQLFLQHIAPTSPFSLKLEIERSEGMYLYSPSGQRWMDLISGMGVSNLGHCHPKVVEAIKSQTEKYLHTMVYGEHIQAPQVHLAKLLCDHLPNNLNSVYFVNSGSEAVEGAMKLAKKVTGKMEIISAKYAYHGSSHGSASLMWPTDLTQSYHPLVPGVSHITYNDKKDLEKITEKTAGVIVETVQSESGVNPPKNDYLRQLRQRCDETGSVLIFDENQTGYGRTGSLFAFEQYDVVPDVLLLAKGMGGGMPIGAFIASEKMMKQLATDPILGHLTTFGGHPVSCAAALATLEYLLESNLIEEVTAKANLFKSLLVHPEIREIRNAGLMMAVQLGDFDFLKNTISHCLDNGIMIDWFLFNDSSLRIAPPLIINSDQIREACRVILEGIDVAAARRQ
ncbi:MAG: aspartate aminotransferase family protein [Bacteroidetes bacterium]|nr:MAG: aspartate aminotransferase family protein [Bacteroidota bacterium]